jgi:hypothetical protein
VWSWSYSSISCPRIFFKYRNNFAFVTGSITDTRLTTAEPGRATAQAVSRRLPTAAPRIRAKVTSCGICGGQSGTGASFLRVLLFPLLILIPPTAPHSLSTTWG